MLNILSFISNYLNLIVIIIFLSITTYQAVLIKFHKKDIQTLEAEKSNLLTQVKVLQVSVKDLKESIDKQNAELEKIKKDAEKKEKEDKETLERASATADVYKKQARDLLKRKPPANMTKCDAANQLINIEARDTKRGK